MPDPRMDPGTGGERNADGLVTLRRLASAYARTEPVRSVAVVGNAPMAPDADRAARIDACDLVVRVNSFVLDRPGDPPTQGRRADVVLWSRLVQATPFLFEGYRERLYVLLEPMRMYGRREMWPSSWPRDLGFVVASNAAVAQPLNDELGLRPEEGAEEGLAPTTGTTAAWLAVRLFPGARILLTGLSYVDRPDQQHWEHQWGDSVVVGPEHRLAPESRMIRSWIDDGVVETLPLGGEEER